jgi:hypothetical protein
MEPDHRVYKSSSPGLQNRQKFLNYIMMQIHGKPRLLSLLVLLSERLLLKGIQKIKSIVKGSVVGQSFYQRQVGMLK